MKKLSNEIIRTIITALEPILVTVIDLITIFYELERKVLNDVFEVENRFIKQIINIITKNSTINNASKIYYIFLIVVDILLVGYISMGKIIYISTNELIAYIILFSLLIASIMNLILKHSKFNEKIKIFSIVQVLIIIPIMVVYWIVSIEGRTFYLKDLNIDQWGLIFNNMLIYFATCIIGIITLYNGKTKSNKVIKKKKMRVT